VTVRLRSFPTLMIVLVVFVMNVKMLMVDGVMYMLQLIGIFRGPHEYSDGSRSQSDKRKNGERHHDSEQAPKPPCERIRQQPAGMGQGKLRSEYGWSVAFTGRSFEKPPCRCLDQ